MWGGPGAGPLSASRLPNGRSGRGGFETALNGGSGRDSFGGAFLTLHGFFTLFEASSPPSPLLPPLTAPTEPAPVRAGRETLGSGPEVKRGRGSAAEGCSAFSCFVSTEDVEIDKPLI